MNDIDWGHKELKFWYIFDVRNKRELFYQVIVYQQFYDQIYRVVLWNEELTITKETCSIFRVLISVSKENHRT